ncbi:MAG: aspartate--tRNA ligase, partial [Acidobacteria bacterium RBG_16_64_8]
MKYRYLDLRRPRMFSNLDLRHRVLQAVRRHLDDLGFIEVETPILTKSTPEGARDFLVPSRLQPGEFYALPQSPQLFKQLLMISGFERYYQIARAFRDEDLRADRQPEHTQIDLEMSFIEEEDILLTVEGMFAHAFKEALEVDLATPFPRITYTDAMARYGSDKPDLRFGMEIVDVTDIASGVDFRVLAEAVRQGGVVRGIKGDGAAVLSRKDIDDLASEAAAFGAQGVVPVWVDEHGVRSPMQKFLTEDQLAALLTGFGAGPGDLLLLVAGSRPVVEASLGALRLALASRLGMPKEG